MSGHTIQRISNNHDKEIHLVHIYCLQTFASGKYNSVVLVLRFAFSKFHCTRQLDSINLLIQPIYSLNQNGVIYLV